MCLLITVCSSLSSVHSLTIVGTTYCAMAFMCVLPDSSLVTVVLLLSGINGAAVVIFPFPPYTHLLCLQCFPPVTLLGPDVQSP